MEQSHCHLVAVSPIETLDGDEKYFSVMISEFIGTYVFIFMFMLSTDSKTQFSSDKVINCFIIASAYVGARLMAGGQLVTGLNRSIYPQDSDTGEIDCENGKPDVYRFKQTGPLLNPALALG